MMTIDSSGRALAGGVANCIFRIDTQGMLSILKGQGELAKPQMLRNFMSE